MGAKASNLGKVAGQAKDAAINVGTHAARKVRRQGNNFNAPERAEKFLEKQNSVPMRAPMNVGKVKVSDDLKRQKMEEFEEHDKKDVKFLSMMKDVYITSKDPVQPTAGPGSMNETRGREKSLPRDDGTSPERDTTAPHGRADRKTIILALHNHKSDPAEWGPAEVAEKIRIRESDCRDLLEYFDILDEDSVMKSDTERVREIPFT